MVSNVFIIITQTAGAGPPTTLLLYSRVVDPSPACLPAQTEDIRLPTHAATIVEKGSDSV
jgi:hypothetical protein